MPSAFGGAAVLGTVLFSGILLWSAGELRAAPKLPRDDLQGVIRAASSVDVFTFPQAGMAGPNRSIATSKTVAGGRLAGDALRRLRAAIFADQSYLGAAGLQKSCPFEPRVAFRFNSGGREAWWLVSETCQSAILVEPGNDWRRVRTLNLTPEATRNFAQWANGPTNGG